MKNLENEEFGTPLIACKVNFEHPDVDHQSINQLSSSIKLIFKWKSFNTVNYITRYYCDIFKYNTFDPSLEKQFGLCCDFCLDQQTYT